MKSLGLNLLTATIVQCLFGDTTVLCENITAASLPMARLYNAIIAPYRYVTRPVKDPVNRTTVYTRVNFMHLIDVNEISSTITVNLWLQIWWQDEIRGWNPVDYEGIDSIQVLSRDVWRPALLAINSNDQRYLFESVDSSIYILSNGNSYWYPGQSLSFGCAMDLTQFPFDSQTCFLSILTRDFQNEVELKSANVGRYDLQFQATYTEWEVIDVSFYTTTRIHTGISNKTFAACDFRIDIKRKAGFFLLNTILPVNLLTLLSLVTFVIPDDSGEKISYSVTVLLSTGIYLSAVSSTLPQSSESLPLVMVYLFSLDVYCALAMLVALATMNFRRKNATMSNNDVHPVKDPGMKTRDQRSDMFTAENNGLRRSNRRDSFPALNFGMDGEQEPCKAKSSQAASTERVHIRRQSYSASMAADNELSEKQNDLRFSQYRLTKATSHRQFSLQMAMRVKNRCPGVISLDVGIILVFLLAWIILTASFFHEMTK